MLEIKNLDLCFKKGTVDELQLFQDFNLNLTKGQFVSIIGSNGSGKTSLLNLICGALKPDQGTISLHGKTLNKMPEHQRYASIGRVFQDPSIGTCGELTVLENLSLAQQKGKRFGLSSGITQKDIPQYKALLSSLEMGLEERLDQPCNSLSGGQRQALSLFMATMGAPKLLILDEHTAALDPKSSERVMQLTEKMVREGNMTALMVTHNLNFSLNYGNRLLMMHEGKILLDVQDEAKKNLSLDDLLVSFNAISIERGNSI